MATKEVDIEFLAKKVDELGRIKARISDLCEQESEIKILLLDSGVSAIDGSKFRATISKSFRETLDTEKVKKLLTPAQLELVTKVTSVASVRVTARTR